MKNFFKIAVSSVFLLATSLTVQASEFPSYLNDKYCTDIKLDFMTSSMRSLQLYREKHLATRHRGGMNNIRNYLVQRQEWLKECDDYMAAEENKHLFRDDDTSKKIFTAIESVTSELASLINGVSYTVNAGSSATDVAAQKFDRLFKLVEDHQTLMLLKGQVVYR